MGQKALQLLLALSIVGCASPGKESGMTKSPPVEEAQVLGKLPDFSATHPVDGTYESNCNSITTTSPIGNIVSEKVSHWQLELRFQLGTMVETYTEFTGDDCQQGHSVFQQKQIYDVDVQFSQNAYGEKQFAIDSILKNRQILISDAELAAQAKEERWYGRKNWKEGEARQIFSTYRETDKTWPPPPSKGQKRFDLVSHSESGKRLCFGYENRDFDATTERTRPQRVNFRNDCLQKR